MFCRGGLGGTVSRKGNPPECFGRAVVPPLPKVEGKMRRERSTAAIAEEVDAASIFISLEQRVGNTVNHVIRKPSRRFGQNGKVGLCVRNWFHKGSSSAVCCC